MLWLSLLTAGFAVAVCERASDERVSEEAVEETGRHFSLLMIKLSTALSYSYRTLCVGPTCPKTRAIYLVIDVMFAEVRLSLNVTLRDNKRNTCRNITMML